jgi:DNA-binding XRE family transcriptional regulator
MSETNFRKKLRQAREKKGWSIHEAATEVAAALNMSRENYYDIEMHEDDLTYCYSLSEICTICILFDIHPKNLFSTENVPPLTIEAVVGKIKDYCVQTGISIEQFEDKAGWRVNSCLSNPKTALDEWNWDCLRDVCRELQVDWRAVVSSL